MGKEEKWRDLGEICFVGLVLSFEMERRGPLRIATEGGLFTYGLALRTILFKFALFSFYFLFFFNL